MNVAALYAPDGSTIHVDLELTNRSRYVPYDSNLNILSGHFAQVNLACDQSVDLRVKMKYSCATTSSCNACDKLSGADQIECFSRGCSCYGATVYARSHCKDAAKHGHQSSYSCPLMDTTLVLPREAMSSMTVYDFDTGPNHEYIEQFIVPEYAFYVTPLRPASGEDITLSLIHI